MKIRPVESSYSMHMDGQTDMTNLLVAFRNSEKALQNRTGLNFLQNIQGEYKLSEDFVTP